MANHSAHSARYLVTHRRLLLRVARNELAARYAGSLLGVGWILLYPLVVIGIYAGVYLLIFRVQVAGFSPTQYVLYVCAGLAPFLMTAEALSSGVSSVVANKFALNSTVFPIDLAPPKAVLISQGPVVVGFLIISLGGLVAGTLRWTALLLPVLWTLYLMALVGLVWILSLIHIVLRDLQSLIGLALMMALIASPIGYTPEMVPQVLRPLILMNPFAYFITAFQQVLVLGQVPGPWHFVVLLVLSAGLFVGGGAFFGRAKQVLVDYV